MKNRKRVWKSFELIKIKLNPEQAVLSCCQSIGKVPAQPGSQCGIVTCPGQGAGADSASS